MEGNEVFKQQVDYPTSHTWGGKDENGKRLDDGIYFVVIKVKTSTETKVFKGKVALLK
jgi:flagellar hook assembly protein FlgD